MKCLGVCIGHDKEECYNKNWMKIYHDMEKLIESWKKRKLTLFGKTCVINTLAISKLIHTASILCLPIEEYVKKTQRLIFKLIWNKTERIKRNTLIDNISDGGLAQMDIDSKLKALKAPWVPRLLNSNSTISKIFKGFLSNLNKTLTLPHILQFSEKSPDKLQRIGQIPRFNIKILGAFNECKKTQTLDKITSSKLLQQPLWINSLLVYKGQSLFFKTWINVGFLYLKDMIGDDGKLIDLYKRLFEYFGKQVKLAM